MADTTKIEWTDATWQITTGCSVTSPGCKNCYAMRLAGTRLQHHPSRAGLTRDTKTGPVWTGEVRFNKQWLDQPLRWRRPRRIFVSAHGDLFHEALSDADIDRVFAVMALCPQHTFQCLTKRSERMRAYVTELRRSERWLTWKHPTFGHDIFDPFAAKYEVMFRRVWLGVSVEDQKRADERIPDLLATSAAVRFVSCEPLLGPVNLRRVDCDGDHEMDTLRPSTWREVWDADWSPDVTGEPLDESIEAFIDEGGVYPPTDNRPPGLDWAIVGAESGPRSRPMSDDWVRSIRDQCTAAGVPFMFKQRAVNGQKISLPELDGRQHADIPHA